MSGKVPTAQMILNICVYSEYLIISFKMQLTPRAFLAFRDWMLSIRSYSVIEASRRFWLSLITYSKVFHLVCILCWPMLFVILLYNSVKLFIRMLPFCMPINFVFCLVFHFRIARIGLTRGFQIL